MSGFRIKNLGFSVILKVMGTLLLAIAYMTAPNISLGYQNGALILGTTHEM